MEYQYIDKNNNRNPKSNEPRSRLVQMKDNQKTEFNKWIDNRLYGSSGSDHNIDPWKNQGLGLGAKMVIISITIIILVLCLWSLLSTVHECDVNKEGYSECIAHKESSFMENLSKNYSKNYHSVFEGALVKAKGGLIVMFVLIAIMYQLLYGSVPAARTYLGSNKYMWSAIIDALVAAGFGMISTAIILASRGGVHNILPNWKSVLIVGILLGTFNFALESSGFNRYLAKSDIEQGIGPYAEIDGITSGETPLPEFIIIEEGGDPFTDCLAYTSVLLIVLVIIYYILIMITTTYFGYKDNHNSIKNATIFGHNTNNGVSTSDMYGFFFVEAVFVAGIMNMGAPLLSPLIRKDKYSYKSLALAISIFFMAVILQIMLQYNGFLAFDYKSIVEL